MRGDKLAAPSSASSSPANSQGRCASFTQTKCCSLNKDVLSSRIMQASSLAEQSFALIRFDPSNDEEETQLVYDIAAKLIEARNCLDLALDIVSKL